MKKSIVIIVFALHIFFAVGMEKKMCSIFQDRPSFSEYEDIFKKIVYSKKVQKLADLRVIENLVLDMEESNLKTPENYMKISYKEGKYTPLLYTSPYLMDVEPVDLKVQKNLDNFFKLPLSAFSHSDRRVINSLPWIDSEYRKEWAGSYMSVLAGEWTNWKLQAIWPRGKQIEHHYLIHYLNEGGNPGPILENAVRFFAKHSIQAHPSPYDHVIEYTLKRYPCYAARYLVNFALETKDLQEKKIALAIVKSYDMLHVAEDDQNLIQHIVDNKTAWKLFLSYGLNIVDLPNLDFSKFHTLFTSCDDTEYTKQCCEALFVPRIPDFQKFETLVLDMQKLCKISEYLDQGSSSYTQVEMYKLPIQKPLLNPESYPIFLNNLLKKIKRCKAEENYKIWHLLDLPHDEMKFCAGIIGIATYFSTLFTALFFGQNLNCSRGFSLGFSDAVVLSLDAVPIFCAVCFLNKKIDIRKKIDCTAELNYTMGYLQGFMGKKSKKAILPIEQEETYKKAVNQKRDFFTIFSCSAFSFSALIALKAIAEKFDLFKDTGPASPGEVVCMFNFFIGMPLLSFLLARWLQEVHYKNAEYSAEKLFESRFERGKSAGFAVFKESLSIQEEKTVEEPAQEPVEKPSGLKAIFGFCRDYSKKLLERIRRIEIRRPGL